MQKKQMDFNTDLLTLILPEVLVSNFTLTAHKKQGEVLDLYFEEKKEIPKEFSSLKLHSKGFHKEITIQDFPLRGHQVFLHIKRRRWIDIDTNKLIERDWNLVAQGTRITNEFAAFLKEINRY